MKVQFWGAAQTVTGSMHLVHHHGKKILLDCGLYQGKRKEAFQRNRQLPFDGAEIDCVILSHAHIDHSGNLPSLIKAGFRGPIYSTSATRDLCAIMLIDSAKIQKSDVRYVNKTRIREGRTPFEPLYVMDDAVQALRQFRTIDFGYSFQPLPGVEAKFHVAGHMLGAATIELMLDAENVTAQKTRLVFSGDIGRPLMPILMDPETVRGVDYLIMEATYGNREHPEGGDAKHALLEAATQVYDSGGKLIIPAFSVGRTQEIIYRLNLLAEANELPPLEVFIDSPLAVNATDVFREHPECFDHEMQEAMYSEDDGDPLMFRGATYIRSVQASKALNSYQRPCVIISASGMCEAGRVLHHLKNNIEKDNTIILFAGYQAPHTLGRLLLDGAKDVVKIFGQPYQVRAKVCKLEGSSGHADKSELLNWAKRTANAGAVKKIALVHCEMEGAVPFQAALQQEGLGPVIIPAPGEVMELV